MYEIAATWCKPKVKRIGVEALEEVVLSMLQKNRSCGGDQIPFCITVKRVDKPAKAGERPRLIEPTITIYGPPKITISAAEATMQTDWTKRALCIECTRGEFDFGGPRMSFPGTEQFSVPIPEPNWDRFHRDWVAMRDISNLIVELQKVVMERQAALQVLEENKPAGVPQPPQEAEKIAATKAEINDCNFKINRLRAESYRRWANGFTCLCFALIGAPVAMLWRHADVLTNFFVCFLPILAIYYPLLMFSDDLATSGKAPPISFWMANLVLAVPATALLRRIVKH
jgi:lipopolysaccharide export system permease protein